MNTTDRNVNAKVLKHVNGKIHKLMDIMVTINTYIDQRSLIPRDVRETLERPHVYDSIIKSLVENEVPMIVEEIKTTKSNIPQREQSGLGISHVQPCV